MIFRISSGRANSQADAAAYTEHIRTSVFPGLRGIAGHRGGHLLQRAADGGVDVLIITIWDSIEAIREFAGDDPEVAIFEPEAQRLLAVRDPRVALYDVVHDAPAPQS